MRAVGHNDASDELRAVARQCISSAFAYIQDYMSRLYPSSGDRQMEAFQLGLRSGIVIALANLMKDDDVGAEVARLLTAGPGTLASVAYPVGAKCLVALTPTDSGDEYDIRGGVVRAVLGNTKGPRNSKGRLSYNGKLEVELPGSIDSEGDASVVYVDREQVTPYPSRPMCGYQNEDGGGPSSAGCPVCRCAALHLTSLGLTLISCTRCGTRMHTICFNAHGSNCCISCGARVAADDSGGTAVDAVPVIAVSSSHLICTKPCNHLGHCVHVQCGQVHFAHNEMGLRPLLGNSLPRAVRSGKCMFQRGDKVLHEWAADDGDDDRETVAAAIVVNVSAQGFYDICYTEGTYKKLTSSMTPQDELASA